MNSEQILDSIAEAGSWLPLTTVRWAFTERAVVAPLLLEAVLKRAAAKNGRDIRNHRLATFGIFYLAQMRERRLFEPLLQLFETANPEAEDEWLFSGRLFFFGHRLLAGVCPHDPQRPLEMALNPKLKPLTRALAVCAIGLLGAYGDIPRAEAITLVRETFSPVRALKEEWTASCWARTAAKLHCRQFEHELQWFLASGLLPLDARQDIARALRGDADVHLLSVRALEPMVDLFSNVFPQDIRSGEIGLLPNGQIPGLEFLLGEELRANRQLIMPFHHTMKLNQHGSPEFSHCCEPAQFGSGRECMRNRLSEVGKLGWISARIVHPPALNDVAGWAKNSAKKCQQKCQQNSTRVARGQNLNVPPASMVNSSISVPKGRGEGRRFRPSPPSPTASAAMIYGRRGPTRTPRRTPVSQLRYHSR